MLSVRDDGIGIVGENLEQVFEPFRRTRSALAGSSSGLGLGLSLVRRVIELHGGHIKATSKGLTKGSEFVAWLPLQAPDGAGDPQPAGPIRTRPASTALHKRRVLIVDDHEEVGKSLVRLVRTLGHEVAIARDGPSALALAESFQPEWAILDLSLPGMNRIELGRQLRAVFPGERLRMIALTGFTGAEIREACLAAGFDEQLTKPGNIDELAQLLGGDPLDTDDNSG